MRATTRGMTTRRGAVVPGASRRRMEIMSRKFFGRRAAVVRVAASAPNPPTVRVRDARRSSRRRAGAKPSALGEPFSRFIHAFERLPSTAMASRLARRCDAMTRTP